MKRTTSYWTCDTCGFIQVDPPPFLEQPPVCRRCVLGEWPDDTPTSRWTRGTVCLGGLLVYSVAMTVALWVCWIERSLY